ncbi:hypothetical protein BGX28_004434 [Mortierella sp. GBA30]|nr:hypothetical protein BGX28_004434 [Mortierella sp. GBA30]
MSYVHRVITGKQILASKCSTLSYTVLTEARLRQIRNEQLSRTISTRSDPEPMPSLSKVVQSTVKRMEGAGARQSHEMYGLWLKSAVEERNWVQGIGAWKGLKANKGQLVEYPISMTIHAIQCYLHAGLIKDATKLCETILERSTTALQKKEYALLMDGGSLPRTDGKLETKVSDRRLEFMRRQRQALKELANMQLMTSMAGSAPESTNSEQILAWKSAAYPALIEALSLEDTDKHGASLASELAMELHNQGHVLDATRFRFLVRYIGASTSSEIAESFVKRWIGLSTTSPSQSTLSLSTKEDLAGNTSSTNLARDSGKATRAAIVPTRNLIDAGLLEVVRQSIEERNFDRACRIFQGLSLQGTPIDADTAEKLIVGLTEDHDFPSATAVLEKSLQDNGAPSVETANILLQGLIHADRLDESVTMFRNLTENHGLKPSVQMYRSLMRLTASYGQLAMAQRILSVLKGLGVKQDWELYRDLMQCYVRSENLQGAIKVFENMDRARIKNRIDHINVLLEGAVRQSSPPTVIGILEIMSSQRITPDPETWNILLSGAFQNKDRVLAQELFQELARSVTPNVSIRTDRNLRASRHPVTFQLLVNEFAERHGVESALKLLKGALDAEYPRGHVAPSLYRDLIEKSCRQHKGVAGFAFYRLLRQSERAYNRPSRISSSVTKDKATLLSPVASLPSPSPTSSFTPSPSLTSTSRSVLPPSPANLCLQLMIQLDEEGEYAHGKDLATDWIISGSEMDQEMVRHAIRFYAKSGEFSTAFGLFTKMGRAYGVEPSREMVMDLVEAIRTHDIGMTMPVEDGASVTPSTQASKDVLDASETQQWLKVLRGAMARFGVSEATA